MEIQAYRAKPRRAELREMSAMKSANVRCDKCRFWEVQPDDQRVGICRRYPPSYDGWAMTDAHNWCGEFVLRAGAVDT